MPEAFYSRRSLNIEVYLARTADLPVIEGDAEFYIELARHAPGPTLELGCGPGRLLVPLAQAGIDVTGIDLSEAMLEVASGEIANAPPDVRARARALKGDMTDFDLGRQFGLVFIAFRSFMMLTTPEEQRRCLEHAHAHLARGGILAIDIFDPLLDRMVPGWLPEAWASRGTVLHPRSYHEVRIEASTRANDPVAQVFEETWRFTEVGRDGTVVREEEEVLRMRWTYRYEMRYLLELCGFTVLAEYSDYAKSPPAYGKEQIWVAQKR